MPVWEAQFILVLAASTGWAEDFIRWRLPLARGFPYYHAARLLDGEDCRWPGHRSTKDITAIRAGIRAAIQNFTAGNE